MGFAATMIYLAMLLLRPQEQHAALRELPMMGVLGTIAIIATAVSLFTERRPQLAWQQTVVVLLFLLWSAASVALAVGWLGGAADRLLELGIQACTFLIVGINVSTARRLVACVALVCCSMLALVGQSASAYYSDAEQSLFFITAGPKGGAGVEGDAADDLGAPTQEEGPAEGARVRRARALGFLNDPNDFAEALVATIPLLFISWHSGRYLLNIMLVVVPAGVLAWGVLITHSRGGLLALLALVPMAGLLRLQRGSRRIAMGGLAVAALPGVVLLFRYALSDESAMGRLEAWSAGLQMLRASPLWGVGSGLFTEHHPLVAHNSFVQCFAETGLVGYFLWLAMLVLSLGQMSSLADQAGDSEWAPWARVVQLSLLGYLVGAMFLSRTTSPMLFLLTGLVAAVASTARLEGIRLPIQRSWPRKTLVMEFVSILVVWITSRAAW